MSASRPKTGPMRFGDDWTGVFVRGDHAAAYALALKWVKVVGSVHDRAMLQGLLDVLAGSREPVTAPVQQLRPFAECAVTDQVALDADPKGR